MVGAFADARGQALAYGEQGKKYRAESHARNGGRWFGKEIGYGDKEKNERDQAQPDRNFFARDIKIPGNFPFSRFLVGKAQHQHGESFEGEAPDNAEGIERRQQIDISSAEDDGQHLKADNQ